MVSFLGRRRNVPNSLGEKDFSGLKAIIIVESNLCKTTTIETPKKVAAVDRWSLFRGNLCYKSSKWDLKIAVLIDRWLLLGDGGWLRFDCISKEKYFLRIKIPFV